jgi:hypothetical protein
MTFTRSPWLVAAGTIVLSGLLLAAAAAARWLPCLSGSEQVCLARQSHAYDYIVPIEPGQPLAVTAVLAGLGMIMVALSWRFIVGQLRIKRRLTLVLSVVMIAKAGLVGLLTLSAAVTGGLPAAATGPLFIGEIVLDLAVLGVVLVTPNERVADYQRMLLAAGPVWLVGTVGRVVDGAFFTLANPGPEVSPGSGCLTAAIIVGCGIGIAAITRYEAPRGRSVATERPASESTSP